MDIIKKFIIEIILVGVFVALCYFGYKYKKQPHISTPEINTTESVIDSLKVQNIVIDSSIHYHISKITNISNHYENEKNNIDSIRPDSIVGFIRAELRHFNERGEFQVSEDYN